METTTCNVCLEEYTETGNRCPKLLPCSHTLCILCCWNISSQKILFQCPECRAVHHGPLSEFPTNRYVLQIIDMQRKITELESEKQGEKALIDYKQARHMKCNPHGKSCVMFCLKKECLTGLCPKCPAQEHQEHKLVGLFECMQDSEELEEIKQQVITEGKLLKEYASQLQTMKNTVLMNAEHVTEQIEDIVLEMKRKIDAEAAELKEKVARHCQDQAEKLEVVQKSIVKDLSTGNQIELEIGVHQTAAVSVEGLINIKNRCEDFKTSSEQKRKMKISCALAHLNDHKRQKLDHSSLIGDVTTKTINVYQKS